MRSSRVFSPFRVSQASKGDWVPPPVFLTNRIRSASSSSFTRTAPPTVALWPSIALVVE